MVIYVGVFTRFQTSIPVSRFSSILFRSGTDMCKSLAWVYIATGTNFLSPLVNIILSLRLYALYQRSRTVLYFLSAICISEIILQVVMSYDTAREATSRMFLAHSSYPLLGCLSSIKKPEITLIQWIPLFLVAAIFLGMTLHRLVKIAEMQKGTGISIKSSPLYRAFVTGGAVFFLIVTIVFPIGAFICIAVKNPLNVSYQPWLNAALSICGSRLILTLRKAETSDVVDDNVLGMNTWNARTINEPITFAAYHYDVWLSRTFACQCTAGHERARWSVPKVLYLVVRYWGILIVGCRRAAWLYISGSNIISPLVNIVLGLRLYALYGRSKKVLWFVSVVCFCEIVIQVVMSWDQGRRATRNMFITVPSYPLYGCLAYVEGREITLISWVTLFVVAGEDSLDDEFDENTVDLTLLYRSILWWLNLALSLAGTRLILTLRRADAADRKTGEQTVLGMETWSAQPSCVEEEPITFR
ncbi:hypothetical protein CVT24_003869 [Panaeolus cyanescens]|uniref:Uncharacterized protein n=1 Tax=Panaeolus cyanescens TaxID=181874 RepID=A0A409VV23_9AGAR|nr:hypothetical protein CVT24_003869 [Panaeolus cyanescens]